MGITVDVVEQSQPCLRGDDEIEETTHGIVSCHRLAVADKLLSDLLRRVLRLLV